MTKNELFVLFKPCSASFNVYNSLSALQKFQSFVSITVFEGEAAEMVLFTDGRWSNDKSKEEILIFKI